MYTGRSYPIKLTLGWTTKFILIFAIISAIPVVLHDVLGFDFILIPWLPIALIGTALAFYLGFKTNASYNRLWEARTIWGAIVNDSRSFAVMVTTYITSHKEEELKTIHKRMIKRHIAWLTALRFQLRARRTWEHNNLRDDKNYRSTMDIEEFEKDVRECLQPHLSENDLRYVMARQNPATHLLHLQMKELQLAHEKGFIDNFRHVELGNMIKSLYDQQGKSERIKNFPFPRQYASLNFYYVWMFIILLPFGMLKEFEQLGGSFIWLNVPFCIVVSWVFYTMEMIGDYSENPFEGSFNDVPITALSRTIEIDLLEIIGETDLPKPIAPKNQVLF